MGLYPRFKKCWEPKSWCFEHFPADRPQDGNCRPGADTLKGVLAILIAMWLGESLWACLYGAAGVLAGHNWPLFLGFRGGKGAATALGVSLAVLPLFTILALAFATSLLALTRNVVLGAASGFVLVNILTVVTGQGWMQILICLFLTLVVTATYLGRS